MNCIRCHTGLMHVVSAQIKDRTEADGHIQVFTVVHWECCQCGTRWRAETPIVRNNPFILGPDPARQELRL